MKKKKNVKNNSKYKKYNNLVVIVKNPNVSKCTVNALIFKFFATKIVTV